MEKSDVVGLDAEKQIAIERETPAQRIARIAARQKIPIQSDKFGAALRDVIDRVRALEDAAGGDGEGGAADALTSLQLALASLIQRVQALETSVVQTAPTENSKEPENAVHENKKSAARGAAKPAKTDTA